MEAINRVYGFLKEKYISKKFLYTYSLFFILSCFIKCGIYRMLTINNFSVDFNFISVFIFTLLSSLLLIGVVFLFSGRKTPLVLLILDIAISVLLMSDNSFFQYYSAPLTVNLLYQLKSLSATAIDKSLFATFNWTFIFYFVPSFVMLYFYIKFKKSGNINDTFVKPLVRVSVSISIVVLSVYFMNVKASSMERMQTFWDRSYLIESIGVLNYHMYDIATAIKEVTVQNTLTDDEVKLLDSYYAKKSKAKPKHFGIAKGKNIVGIQVEALQGFIIDQKFNGKEITPNLNRLKNEGIYFNNMIQQTGDGNTSDAEFIFHNSLLPINRGSVNFIYPNNKLHPLAEALKKQDYKTKAFHAFTPFFWNREIVYPNFGFDRFYSKNDFEMDEIVGWSISDKSLYRQMLEKTDTDSKFYSFNVSLSSHFPYEYTLEHPFDKEELDDTMLGNYMQAINYADAAIGKLINELKKKDLYDDTVIVLYGDHKALMKEDMEKIKEYLQDEVMGDVDVDYKKYLEVPCIIVNSGLKPQVVDEVCGQIDIMPTLANIMGVQMPYALGNDMLTLKNGEGFAVQPDGTVYTNKHIRMTNSRVYNRRTLTEVHDKKLSKKLAKHIEQLNISNIIIKKNAFSTYKVKAGK